MAAGDPRYLEDPAKIAGNPSTRQKTLLSILIASKNTTFLAPFTHTPGECGNWSNWAHPYPWLWSGRWARGMVGDGPWFLDDAAEITRRAITHSNICNKMPLLGVAPATLTPIAQPVCNLQKRYPENATSFTCLMPKLGKLQKTEISKLRNPPEIKKFRN